MITALAVISLIAIFGGLLLVAVGSGAYDDVTAGLGFWVVILGIVVGVAAVAASRVNETTGEIDALRLQVEELQRELERQ